MKLILVRGLPGSGKSTWAKVNHPDVRLLEADMYFCRDGVYNFEAKLLPAAHGWCRNQTRDTLKSGKDVVVANTFTQAWEMEEYALIAREYGAELCVVEMCTQFQNIHGVPEDAIERMTSRWHDEAELRRRLPDVSFSYEQVR